MYSFTQVGLETEKTHRVSRVIDGIEVKQTKNVSCLLRFVGSDCSSSRIEHLSLVTTGEVEVNCGLLYIYGDLYGTHKQKD